MKSWAYIRVSTREQNEDRQVIAMREFGVPDGNMIIEKQSGKDFERPKYQKLMKQIKPGDVLVVKSIDRLGRNYDEILEQWRLITKEKQAYIVVLDMPLLDTRAGRDLTGTLIADIVLQLLSYVAQTEREFIRQRQREGIDAAKARGRRFGRPRCQLTPEDADTIRRWRSGEIGLAAAERLTGLSRSTLYRLARGFDITPDSAVE